ncbi:hypothetical protein H2200_010797 [Cladophialophora chaetospira]|uniref:Uncharacterized protein n=1 Tax=Cladophialophora chaetospira TaxID=386627 RepID=A0AA38X0S0_9EURO|nr:hypothetical protein H2200_010797 [Cladophialophora chaetospira]
MNDTADNYDFRLQWLVYDNQRWMKVDGKDVPAPPEEHNDTSAREILTGALHKVVLAAQRSLHKKVKIGILSYPDHWNSTSRLSAFNAAKEVDTSYGEPWQLRRFFQVVASAYSDAYCTSLLTSVAPDDEPLEWILIINQELNRVETFVGSIDSVGPYLEGKSTVVLDEVGSVLCSGSLVAPSDPEQPITEDAASLEGNQQVRESWLSVVEQHLPSWTSRSSSDLETVIIAGELSPNTARITAKAISNILDISPDKVVIDHSPYRAALGAACHAYRMKIYQPRPIEDCSIPSSLPPELMVKSQDLERLVESMRISLPSSVQLQN